MKWGKVLLSVIALPFYAEYAVAEIHAPWGSATEIQQVYSRQKWYSIPRRARSPA